MCKPKKPYRTLVHVIQTVVKELGYGHREAVYQRAIVAHLAALGIPAQIEVPVPFFVQGICVGQGRIDILTKSHIIELKATHMTPTSICASRQQLQRYTAAMKAAGATPRRGIIAIFDPTTMLVHVEHI